MPSDRAPVTTEDRHQQLVLNGRFRTVSRCAGESSLVGFLERARGKVPGALPAIGNGRVDLLGDEAPAALGLLSRQSIDLPLDEISERVSRIGERPIAAVENLPRFAPVVDLLHRLPPLLYEAMIRSRLDVVDAVGKSGELLGINPTHLRRIGRRRVQPR